MDDDDDDFDELAEGRDDLEGLFDALLRAGDRRDRAARCRGDAANRGQSATAHPEGCG